MAKNLMIQGTMSGAGKSILTAGILRVLYQDGFSVAPFKSQNMALNSFVTIDGKEIGRAQALQAAASCKSPSADMNPILLKPMGDTTSQIIVNGVPYGNMKAAEYFRKKTQFIPDIKAAYEKLSSENDIIVIEGAGSPVEINLRENDIVNMGLAQILDAPVLLAGNIDPGGVFAQLLGTVQLMPPEEQSRIKGLIINKFRGDVSLLEPGLTMFSKYCDIPFAGIVPFVPLDLDEEDSVSERLKISKRKSDDESKICICVIRLPFISNYTDFSVFEGLPEVSLIYANSPEDIDDCDLVIIPGTKNTLADLRWLKESGLANKIIEKHNDGAPIIGICGGFQMLGKCVRDISGEEGGGDEEGLGLLPIFTEFKKDKTLRQTKSKIGKLSGIFERLSGTDISGYEIHMGESFMDASASNYADENSPVIDENTPVITGKNALGTYIHGIFDTPEFSEKILEILYEKKGITSKVPNIEPADVRQNRELNRLADVLKESLDWKLIYNAIGTNR
ncbi:cobyric acid synthase [Butyrivibrio sp. AD3002]|uniref:cobyric acid synthase n=1 Tax=Butyrivibrio sp. AD3002 TaxID=1280670 RepID=UPI0003B5F2C0|nr:cobyric acid synthase [Butyrivibrio sp. AD3002]